MLRSTSGFWSATKTIDTTGFDVGAHLSLALNPMGQPSIAYYEQRARSPRNAIPAMEFADMLKKQQAKETT